MECTSETLGTHISEQMTKGMQAFRKQLTGLRAGRASPALLESIVVEVYGARTPLAQLSSINVPEARMLVVQVWDSSVVSAVEKAIRTSPIGLNPAVDGNLIRVPIPELTQNRREELLKTVRTYTEDAKVSLRHIRRQGLELLDILEKKEHLSEDAVHTLKKDLQKITDTFIADVDKELALKEKEMMTL